MPEEPSTDRHSFTGDATNVFQGDVVNVHNGPERVVPREGPPVNKEWTGRDGVLMEIDATLLHGTWVALVGDEGVGTTSVAAMVTDRNRVRYLDGQLFIRLEYGTKLTDVLFDVLVRLNVLPSQIPNDPQSRLSLFQSRIRDKAILIVLDGEVTDEMIAAFKPVSPRSGYVVASKRPVKDRSFRTHRIGPLEPEDAAEFYRRACPGLNPAAPAQLVECFGTRPRDLDHYAGQINQRHLTNLLDILAAVGENSENGLLGGLSEPARTLYHLFATIHNREFEPELTSIFKGSTNWKKEVLEPFAELQTARLIKEHRPGWFRIEPGTTGADDSGFHHGDARSDVFNAARDAILWHLRRAQLADQEIMECRFRFAPAPPTHIDAPGFNGKPEAAEWLRTQIRALGSSLNLAKKQQWGDIAWGLAEALWAYYNNTARDDEAVGCYRDALSAVDDPTAQAQLSSLLALSLSKTDALEEADQVIDKGMEHAGLVADPKVRKRLLGILTEVRGRIRFRQGRYEVAIGILRESCDLMEAAGETRAVGIRLRVIAEIRQATGELEAALETWEQAVECFKEPFDLRNHNGAKLDMAMLRYRRGDDDALPDIDELLQPVDAASLWQLVAETHERVAAVMRDRGEPHLPRAELALRLFDVHGAVRDAERVRREFGLN